MTTDNTTGWPDTPRASHTPPGLPRHEPEPDQTATPPDQPVTPEESGGNERALSPEDEAKALELAAGGISYRRIGALFGVSHMTIWRTVQRALADHHDEKWSNLRDFVARESIRLDRLDQAWLPKALRGEPEAAKICIRVHAARVRLAAAAGLTSPNRSAVTVTTQGGNSVIDQEIAALVAKLEAQPGLQGPPQ